MKPATDGLRSEMITKRGYSERPISALLVVLEGCHGCKA